MKQLLRPLFFLCVSASLQAQAPASDLDFWLGEWNLRWQETDSTEATGTNRITRDLSGQVVGEHFHVLTGQSAGFEGKSWSVYDTRSQSWKQTWVDNQSGYLDFAGGKEGDTFVFQRQFLEKNGKVVQQKMVFRDIRPDAFTWDWMRSDDEGRTWVLNWQIFYSRK